MPYKDPEVRKAYQLAHSRLPAQKARAALRRKQPGYEEYMSPIRRKNVLQRYGLTPEGYASLYERQGGCCAVCGTDKPGNGRGDRYLDVDHCHETGKVRGLLCRKCNVTAGVLEKNRERIALIEEYLKAHEPQRSEETNRSAGSGSGTSESHSTPRAPLSPPLSSDSAVLLAVDSGIRPDLHANVDLRE